MKRKFLKAFFFSPTYHQRQLVWMKKCSSSVPWILNHFSGLYIHWGKTFLFHLLSFRVFTDLIFNALVVSVFILFVNMNASSYFLMCINFIGGKSNGLITLISSKRTLATTHSQIHVFIFLFISLTLIIVHAIK